MTSLFDHDEFNARLFFPRADVSPLPPGAIDRFVEVPGARLHLRRHGAPGARATVLLFHGNGEVVADYDDAAPSFARAGASLAVVDFRGYGRSTGRPTLRTAILDAPLVLAALAGWVAEEGGGALVVMGRSVGSACAAHLYGETTPGETLGVAGFVLESGSSDWRGLVRRRGLAAPAELSPDDALFDPLPKLSRGRAPLLVLHGERDTLIAPEEARVAYAAAATERKTLALVPGRGHNDVSFSPVYWEGLGAFLGEISG